MEQTRNGLDPLSREASPLDTTHTRETGARANSVPDDQEELVQRLLCRVEDLYEQIGTPYLRPAAPRRAWDFVRALGATRLAAEFSAPRQDVVVARAKAFARWRYWFFRYEQPIWQEIAGLGAHEWDRNFLRYLAMRAQLRHGTITQGSSILLALALRSISTTTWSRAHDTGKANDWQALWRACLHTRSMHDARTLKAALRWSERHFRRATLAVRRLQHLALLPLGQRQLLALSEWPEAHLTALRLQGRALFPGRVVTLTALPRLTPREIAGIAQEARERRQA